MPVLAGHGLQAVRNATGRIGDNPRSARDWLETRRQLGYDLVARCARRKKDALRAGDASRRTERGTRTWPESRRS